MAQRPRTITVRPEHLSMSLRRRLLRALILSFLVVGGGTLGYRFVEGWNYSDSFYMTVISITTVGYGEVRPLDFSGRILTALLIIGGISIFGYSVTVLASSLVESEITGRARERRMRSAIEALSNHVIICGFGRVGISVAREFQAEGTPFVLIDSNADRVAESTALGYLVVEGDATDDLVLSAAGIDRAHALISALDDDAQNVFITLSARVLNPDLIIASRSSTPETERKLQLAGAQHVVSPYNIAGHRLAGVVVRPRVIEFLDTVIYSAGLEFWLEEIVVSRHARVAGETLLDSRIGRDTGALLLAIVRADGTRIANPKAETRIQPGDTLLAIGTREELSSLSRIASTIDDRRRPELDDE
ncbi:MAG: potassium channel protein [Thermomicrobiales bacterium]